MTEKVLDNALKIGTKLGNYGIKKLKGKTTQERTKEAKAKIEKIKAKEKVLELEATAKAAEAEYKRKHPKRFGIF